MSKTRSSITQVLLLSLVVLLIVALPGGAAAQGKGKGGGGGGGAGGGSTDGHFTCRASLTRVDLTVLGVHAFLEPVVANPDNDPCTTDDDGIPNQQISLQPTLDVAVTAKLLWASTVNDPRHRGVAETGVADVHITLLGQTITAEVLTAEAHAACVNGKPQLSSTSTVVGVRVNNTVVNVPTGQEHVEVAIVDALGLHIATLHLNETIPGSNKVTQRALWLEVHADDLVSGDIVIAEAIADFTGKPCDRKAPPTEPGWMTGGGWIDASVGRVTNGFRLECNPANRPNNLQINWPGNGFHLEHVNSVSCSFDPAVGDPAPPPASFNTISGSGTGRCRSGGSATVAWKKTDAGEPGKGRDRFEVTISGSCSLSASGLLGGGNQQAHDRRVK